MWCCMAVCSNAALCTSCSISRFASPVTAVEEVKKPGMLDIVLKKQHKHTCKLIYEIMMHANWTLLTLVLHRCVLVIEWKWPCH